MIGWIHNPWKNNKRKIQVGQKSDVCEMRDEKGKGTEYLDNNLDKGNTFVVKKMRVQMSSKSNFQEVSISGDKRITKDCFYRISLFLVERKGMKTSFLLD